MDTFSAFVLIVWITTLSILGLLLAAFARSDCDFTLGFYEKFGRRPSSVFAGKVVWITGASSGIGEQLAYALAACGARLVLSARSERGLRSVLEKCKGELSCRHHSWKVISLAIMGGGGGLGRSCMLQSVDTIHLHNPCMSSLHGTLTSCMWTVYMSKDSTFNSTNKTLST